MFLLCEGTEVVAVLNEYNGSPPPGMTIYEVTKDVGETIYGRSGTVDPDGNMVMIPGMTITIEQLNEWQSERADQLARLDVIASELAALVGLNVLSLTDAQRWKLVGAVFFKLGVISANGIILPYHKWLEAKE